MLIRHRTFKQIIIAIIFFGFWFSLGGVIIWASYDPAPPVVAPRTAEPLRVLEAIALPIGNGRYDFVGLVSNPNSTAGSGSFKYRFVVKQNGQTVKTIAGQTFILPSDRKYIVAFSQELPTGSDLVLEVGDTSWNFVKANFEVPEVVLVNKTAQVLPREENDLYELKGLLANQSDYDYSKVEVTVVGLDIQGDIIGVSHTFLGSLKSLERREFTAQWPLAKGQTVNDVRIIPEVNLFAQEAIQKLDTHDQKQDGASDYAR